jgi:hypothetical protein
VIISAIVWFLQDILQVLAMGIMLTPEFFLLIVVFQLVSGPLQPRRIAGWVWFSFLGGVLWDLRWAAAPGMSGIINAAAVVLVYWIWDSTPIGGRSALLFATLAGGMHLLSGIVHYVAWAVPSQAAFRLFVIQQLLTVPVLAALCMLYAFKASQTHV